VFSCGGFILGVTWNHAVAERLAQFLQAVGELARGLPPPSVAPVRWDDSLQSLSAVLPLQHLKSMAPLDDLACLGFTHRPLELAPSTASGPSSVAGSVPSRAPCSTTSAPSCGFGCAAPVRAVMYQAGVLRQLRDGAAGHGEERERHGGR
jgi:hypothetical protein